RLDVAANHLFANRRKHQLVRNRQPKWVGQTDAALMLSHVCRFGTCVNRANVFPGYWKRPEETAKVLRNGWFHTGDQGEVSAAGNWKISGRIKNLIILNSGHNIAPEPIEDELLNLLPNAQQVVLVGNGR